MQYFVLERALNFLIQTGAINTAPLDSKIIQFSLQDLPLEVNFICTNDRIFVVSDTDKSVDVDIKLSSSVFFALFKGENLTELLRQDRIKIHGDVKTAQLLVDMLEAVDVDLEEVLSQYVGDIAAHEIGKIATAFKRTAQKSDNLFEALKDSLSDLIISPAVSESFKNKHH